MTKLNEEEKKTKKKSFIGSTPVSLYFFYDQKK